MKVSSRLAKLSRKCRPLAKGDLEQNFAEDLEGLTSRATQIQSKLNDGQISPSTFVEEMADVDSGTVDMPLF